MAVLREYALSIIITALICGILSGILPGNRFVRILCGLVMTLTLLRPLQNGKLPALDSIFPAQLEQGESIAQQGKALAQDAVAESIKAACEAYILDKAKEIGASITVEITLNAEDIPESAQIGGNIAPNQKERISAILQNDLGITEENQVWTK